MKTKMKFVSSMLIILLLTLALSACDTGNSTDTGTPAGAAETVVPTEAPSTPGSCLVGSWNLTDFNAYMASFFQNINTMTEGEFTITSGESSGVSTFVFNADNTANFSAENFLQTFTMTVNTGGSSLDIPVSMNINGTSTSNYSVDGDKISFSGQDNGDIVITTDIMGEVSEMDQSLFGQPDTIQLYQYSCVDANTLTLKVIAVDTMDLAPLTLTRIP